ncbi:hypothetical protein BDN67DRAFT_827244 [Paxillus ammoniavirescens]|nr:hypothetical protein BDN67DRAFT_827244 [Paxillus ammoniavirescens]
MVITKIRVVPGFDQVVLLVVQLRVHTGSPNLALLPSTIETRVGTPSPEPPAVTVEDGRHIVPSTDFGFLPILERLRHDPESRHTFSFRTLSQCVLWVRYS